METTDLVKRLESVGSRAEAEGLLSSNRNRLELGRVFLQRTLHLYGEDHVALGRIGQWASLVVRYSDDKSFAYRALGIYEHGQGRFRQSATAFIKAGSHTKDPSEALRSQIGAIDAFGRAGDTTRAEFLGHALNDRLMALGQPGLAGLARINLANALLQQDRYEESRQVLRGIPEIVEASGFLAEAVVAHLALSTSHLFGGDLETSREEAELVLRKANDLDLAYHARHARLNLAYVALLKGRYDECLSALISLRQDGPASGPDEFKVLEYSGDAYGRLNLWDEAISSYREALQLARFATPLQKAHLSFGLGQVLSASGQTEAAAIELSDAVVQYRKIGNPSWLAAVFALQAEVVIRQRARAARLAFEAVRLSREAKSPYHLCRSLITLAHVEGDAYALDEASRLVRKYLYGGLEWRIHALRAKIHPSRAIVHYRKMLEAMQRERSFASSTASRASYLRDKSEALRDFLEILLTKPSPKRIQEAISVLERTRSIALLDEIISAHPNAFGKDIKAELDGLRAEIENTLGSAPSDFGARSLIDRKVDLSGFQRRWIERTHRLLQVVESPIVRKMDTSSFVLTRHAVHVISEEKVWRLPLTPEEIDERLKWLHFELLEPMLHRDASPERAEKLLRELGTDLLLPWFKESKVGGITPDGILWRVPWMACAHAVGVDPVELRLHPSLGGNSSVLAENPRAGLWVAQHSDLEYAGGEAKSFLEIFPNAQVAGTATEAREMLGGRLDVLHVVAHAKHRWTNPMFSSIEFPDGPLFASEIAQSSLEVKFVMLSACDTGAVSIACQDEPDGFARAFLGRGASAVIGSAWPLDDEAAYQLTLAFYRNYASGRSVLRSLWSAQEEARKWRPHPYFWASHLVYGGYIS